MGNVAGMVNFPAADKVNMGSAKMPDTIHPIVRQIVNRLHHNESDVTVIRAIRNGLSPKGKAPNNREARKDLYRQGIVQQFRNKREYIEVMSGFTQTYSPKDGTNLAKWNANYWDPWSESK